MLALVLVVSGAATGGREGGGEGEEEGGGRRWGEVIEPKMFSIHHSARGVPMRCEFRFNAPEGKLREPQAQVSQVLLRFQFRSCNQQAHSDQDDDETYSHHPLPTAGRQLADSLASAPMTWTELTTDRFHAWSSMRATRPCSLPLPCSLYPPDGVGGSPVRQ